MEPQVFGHSAGYLFQRSAAHAQAVSDGKKAPPDLMAEVSAPGTKRSTRGREYRRVGRGLGGSERLAQLPQERMTTPNSLPI